MIKYRRDIDGLRGIAVLSVVGYHAFPATIVGGFVGVDIFFVISGFLISSIIFEGLRQDRFSYLDFYVRRIRRIFPALVIVLTTSLIFGWYVLVADEYRDLGKNTAAGAGFIANFAYWFEAGYFDKNRGLKPLLHLWSLGVEEQYYLIWPALISLLWTRTRNLLPLIGVLLVVSLALNVVFAGSNPDATFYLPDTRFWELMCGSALAYATVCRRETLAAGTSGALAGPVTSGATSRKTIANVAACFGLLLLAGALLLINDNNTVFPGWWALMPTAGAFLLIAAGPDTAVNRLGLGARPLVFVGLISYPLYLWHWPLLAFANILYDDRAPRAVNIGLVALSFVLAWLTYRAIERPVRMSTAPATWVTLLILCFVVGGAGWLVYANDGFEFRAVNQRNGEISRLIANSRRESDAIHERYKLNTCDDLAIDARARGACTSYGSPTADAIVLWGDSHSEAWAPVFYSIADESGLRVIRFTHGGCPPLVGIRRTDIAGRSVGRCSTFGAAESVVAAIKVIRPKHIFMIGSWTAYANLLFIETSEQDNMKDPKVRQAALQSHLVSTLRQLTTEAPVTIFRSVPILYASAPTGLLRNRPLAPSLAQHREFESSFDRTIDAAVADVPNVTTFDPATLLCKSTCAVILDGKLLYWDDNHITPQGALLFKASLLRSQFDVPSAH